MESKGLSPGDMDFFQNIILKSKPRYYRKKKIKKKKTLSFCYAFFIQIKEDDSWYGVFIMWELPDSFLILYHKHSPFDILHYHHLQKKVGHSILFETGDHLAQQTRTWYKAYPDRLILSTVSSGKLFLGVQHLCSGLCSVIAS